MDGVHKELAQGLIGLQTAPFVANTYHIVCDPRTDALIRWGRGNNSFLIANPAGFSRLLLPCFFKHSNFSSFIRQLNTYGFRKVHPDRWEFAHVSFLRDQTHLLPHIVRRKKRGEGSSSSSGVIVGGEDNTEEEEASREALFEEVERLRQEQTAIGEQLARINRRLQATERRPDQLMSFLARFAEDPHATRVQFLQQADEKKRQRTQLHIPPPLPAQSNDAIDAVRQWAEQKPLMLPTSAASSGVQQVPEFLLTETTQETPFPFCLLGQYFF